MKVDFQDISAFPLFDQLSSASQADFSKRLIKATYDQGAIIQVEGEECRWVGFIASGAVQVYRSSASGREQILHTLGPGMQFNGIPALKGIGLLKASARALTGVTLFILNVTDFRELMLTRVDFSNAIAVDFARRLEHMTGLVEDLSLHSVRGRLARLLLDEADKKTLSKQWTQDEIAARLGTVRDVIGRTLRGFIETGLIRREGGRLLLVDRSRLEEEAEL